MSARFQVVLDVCGQGAAQSALVHDDDVVQALAANGSDQALRVGVTGRMKCRERLGGLLKFYCRKAA